MPKYRVDLVTTSSFTIEVEAEDKDEAIEKAAQEVPGICARCSGWGQDYSLELGDEWDIPRDGKLDDYVEEIQG
jgi:hypothetical protein